MAWTAADIPPQTGRIAVVTGATSGLGYHTALELARAGAEVVLAVRDTARGDQVRVQTGAAAVVRLDLSEQASVRAAAEELLARWPRIDVLVNNAGVPLTRPAVDVTEAEWDEVMNVNLRGAFFMSQQVGRHLIAAKRPGAIVSIASTHGAIGLADRSTYGISKAGIIQMTRMLAIEWADHGIRVNAVAPATVETPSRAAVLAANPERRRLLMARIPLGRFGTAEEMADAVAYLASPRAAFVTGQTLFVDGGLTAY